MKAFLNSMVAGLLAVALTGPVAFAEERPAFSQEELDQMLAPIALYPDSLLSQILMASTYPLEVVQAARWSRANSHLQGENAVKSVEAMDWDPSVKSLVAFPQILHRMDERLDWTQRLGEAFLAQEPHVMDTIQGLRQRAAAAGNLRSDEQMRVARQDDYIMIEPARPETVYVPYYNPAVVYGPWWWPAYPPVYWGPPPGYYAAPVFAPGFFWGPAIVISTGFFFGHCNWHHRHVTVVHQHVQVSRTRFGKPHTVVTSHGKPVVWKHNPAHRKGVPYRHAALRKDFGRSGGGDARRDGHRPGATAPATQRGGQRFGSTPQQGHDQPANERGRESVDNDRRGSKSVNPSVPDSQQRGESGRDNSRSPGRGSVARPAPSPPTVGQQRPDSSANSVLRFQERPASNGNNVVRLNGRSSPASQPAPAARAVRQAQRPPVAVQQSTRRPVTMPQHQSRPPLANGHGNRIQAGRSAMAPRFSSHAPHARAAASRGSGNHSASTRGGRGGGSIR